MFSCSGQNNQNIPCIAYFTPNTYTITLNKKGGSSSQSMVKIKYNTSSFLNSSTLASTTITTPTRTGYTFNGWYTASSGGSLIIEQIFGIPGVGPLYINSITALDYNFFLLLKDA